jgi:PleD family two-component response regulator
VERTRLSLEHLPLKGMPPLTFSAGVCALDNVLPPLGARELMRLADVALYTAKAGGRNAVVRYAPDARRSLTPMA